MGVDADGRWIDGADQIDLGKYLAIVRHRWLLIVSTVLVAVIAALGASEILTQIAPRYQSVANVLLTGQRYKLNFDPKFTTVDPSTVPNGVSAASRVDEYRAIAMSSEVRQAVLQRGDGAPQAERAGRVTVDIAVKGQLISVTATDSDPTLAQRAADAYAAAIATRLDAVYGQTEQDQAALQRQLGEAVQAQSQAEAGLAAFTVANHIDDLTREISRKEAVAASVASQQMTALQERLQRSRIALAEARQISRSGEVLLRQAQATDNSRATLISTSLALMGRICSPCRYGRRRAISSGAPQPSRVGEQIRWDYKPNLLVSIKTYGGTFRSCQTRRRPPPRRPRFLLRA